MAAAGHAADDLSFPENPIDEISGLVCLLLANNKKTDCLPRILIYFEGSLLIGIFQGLDSGGILETTVDHSDIRGLATA